jgi:S-adenosylmethionine uptake transporter
MNTPVLKGILFATAGFALFSGQDAIIKSFDGQISVFQIIFFGMIFALLPLTYYVALHPEPMVIQTRSPMLMTARVITSCINLVVVFYAFNTIPLQHVYAILFAAPGMITLLAIPFLGEKIQIFRTVALIIGFTGILIVLRPNLATMTLGHLAAFLAAILIAINAIITRKLGDSESRVALVIYPLMGNIIFCGVMMFWFYEPMDGLSLFKLAAVGLVSVIAQSFIVQAYTRAPAAVVAPFQYSQMLWAILFGAYFFNESTDKWTWIGTAIIITSGLLILYRESLVKGSTKPLTNATNWRGGPSIYALTRKFVSSGKASSEDTSEKD